MSPELIEVLRWVNVALSMLLLMVVVAATVLHLEQLTPREKRIRPWSLALLATIAYGSGEAAQQGATAGIRTPILALVLTGLLLATCYRFRDRDR